MPEWTLYKIDESHDALEAEFFSPEEYQTYAKAMTATVPEGSQLICRQGLSKGKRPTLTIGVVPLGETLPLRNEDGRRANKPAEPNRALEIPEVVRKATDDQLETMAVKNHLLTEPGAMDKWHKANRKLREAEVAKALKKVNSTQAGVGRSS